MAFIIISNYEEGLLRLLQDVNHSMEVRHRVLPRLIDQLRRQAYSEPAGPSKVKHVLTLFRLAGDRNDPRHLFFFVVLNQSYDWAQNFRLLLTFSWDYENQLYF